MKHQRLQLVPTFCKLSQFQFGSLQCLLSQIDYRFAGPSSLMSLCVWPFQTIVRFLRSLLLWSCLSPFQITLRLLLQSLLPLLLIITITTYYLLLYSYLYYYYTYTTIYTTIILPLPLRLILLPISTYSLAKLYTNYTIMAGCSVC